MKNFIIKFIRKLKLEFFVVGIYFNFIRKVGANNIEFDIKEFKNINFRKGNIKKYEEIPKIIWMFWSEPCIPYDIEICISRIKSLNPNYEINILNKYTIKKFIIIDLDNENMPLANISDLIRLRLLNQYGGVWLDASIIMNKPIDWFINKEGNIFDLIAFYREVTTVNDTYPVLESWFLIAPKESRYIKKWLKVFEPVEVIGSSCYFQKIKNRIDYLEIKQKISPPDYLIVYLANQITMKEIKNCNLSLYLSDKSAYLLQDTLGWRAYKTHAYLALLDAPNSVSPIYKLTSGDRKYMNIIFNKKIINPKSILGVIEN